MKILSLLVLSALPMSAQTSRHQLQWTGLFRRKYLQSSKRPFKRNPNDGSATQLEHSAIENRLIKSFTQELFPSTRFLLVLRYWEWRSRSSSSRTCIGSTKRRSRRFSDLAPPSNRTALGVLRRAGCRGRYWGLTSRASRVERDCVSRDNSVAFYIPLLEYPQSCETH